MAMMTSVPRSAALSSRSAPQSGKAVLFAMVFILSLMIPVQFFIGDFLLSPYRVIVLVGFMPLVFSWLIGGCGRILVADIFVLLFAIWIVVSLVVAHGSNRLAFGTMSAIETFGAYLLGRRLVQGTQDMGKIAGLWFVILLFLTPAAILEATTGARIYNDLFSVLGQTFPWVNYEQRLGMYRAQTVFEHPILYGVFSALAMSILYYSWRDKTETIQGLRRAWIVPIAVFFSLSSGAFMATALQIGLMVWHWILRAYAWRWRLLIGLVILAYISIDLLSNRTPFEVFATYMTFSSGTAYWRILIFQYGMDNVWAKPIFGRGLTYWVRPLWMYTASIDNFWLLVAVRNGIPAFLFIALAMFSTIWQLGRRKLGDPKVANYRMALVFTLISLSVSISTVHMWGASYVFMMFLLGACGWFMAFDQQTPDEVSAATATEGDESPEIASPAPSSRYTRFSRTGPASQAAPRQGAEQTPASGPARRGAAQPPAGSRSR